MCFTLCLGDEKVEEKGNKLELLGLVSPVYLVLRNIRMGFALKKAGE